MRGGAVVQICILNLYYLTCRGSWEVKYLIWYIFAKYVSLDESSNFLIYIFLSCTTCSLTRGVWKFIELTRGVHKIIELTREVHKIIEHTMGGGKKNYRPEGPVFGPKQRFFYCAACSEGNFRFWLGKVVIKFIELTRGVRKFIGWTRGVVRSMSCNIKKIIYNLNMYPKYRFFKIQEQYRYKINNFNAKSQVFNTSIIKYVTWKCWYF